MVMLPWSPPSTMTKVMRWTLETFFFVGAEWRKIVWILVCWKIAFFQTPCVFKLRVIAQMLILWMKVFDFRAISDRYASSTRELNLDIQASEKTEVFLYRWKTDAASHDATNVGCLVNPRIIIAYFFGLLLSLDFANLMCHGGNLWNMFFVFPFPSRKQKHEVIG